LFFANIQGGYRIIWRFALPYLIICTIDSFRDEGYASDAKVFFIMSANRKSRHSHANANSEVVATYLKNWIMNITLRFPSFTGLT
jgi:hypothetical protein